MHDAGAVVVGDEVGRDHSKRVHAPVRRVVDGHEVERAVVVEPDQVVDRDRAHDLGVVAEHRLHPGRGHHEVAPPLAPADAHVLDLRADGGGDVRDQRPRRRRPDQEVEVALDHREPHVHRRLGDVLVALRDLVTRQRGPTPAAVGDDLEALVDEPPVPHLLEVPPHALDVVVGERPVRVGGVEPHADARRERGPVLDVAVDRLAAAPVELGDAVLLDLVLAGEAELLLDLELHRADRGSPSRPCGRRSGRASCGTGVEVLERPGPDVVQTGPAVRGRRPLVEHPLGCALAAAQALGEHVVVGPALLHPGFELDEVDVAVDGVERHRRERIVRVRAFFRRFGASVSGVNDLYSFDGKDVVLRVHVQPRAGRSAVLGRHGRALKLRVAAPPVDERANQAVVALVAEMLEAKERQVSIESGDRSRVKRVRIAGLDLEDVESLLERALVAAAEPEGPRKRRAFD